jgi:hypothetical protein
MASKTPLRSKPSEAVATGVAIGLAANDLPGNVPGTGLSEAVGPGERVGLSVSEIIGRGVSATVGVGESAGLEVSVKLASEVSGIIVVGSLFWLLLVRMQYLAQSGAASFNSRRFS